jgi:hypothetical protein
LLVILPDNKYFGRNSILEPRIGINPHFVAWKRASFSKNPIIKEFYHEMRNPSYFIGIAKKGLNFQLNMFVGSSFTDGSRAFIQGNAIDFSRQKPDPAPNTGQ